MPTGTPITAIDARLNRTAKVAETVQGRSINALIASSCRARLPEMNFSASLNAQRQTTPTISTQYTVKSGESLSQICENTLRKAGQDASPTAVDSAVRSVALENGIRDPNLIAAGQTLNLKSVASSNTISSPRAQLPSLNRIQHGVIKTPSPQIIMNTPNTLPQASSTPENKSTLEALAKQVVSTAKTIAATEPSGRSQAVEALRNQFNKQVSPEQTANLIRWVESIVTATEKSKMASASANRQAPLARIAGDSATVSSDFGLRPDPFTGKTEQHNGIDLAVAPGTTVYPATAGTVVSSGWMGSYGKTVVVRHADNTETLYAHNEKVSVKTGDKVTASTPIAQSGSTGRSTGPHLHFEVRRNDRAINPTAYLASLKTDSIPEKNKGTTHLASARRASFQITKTL